MHRTVYIHIASSSALCMQSPLCHEGAHLSLYLHRICSLPNRACNRHRTLKASKPSLPARPFAARPPTRLGRAGASWRLRAA